jgi:hypothetical protein
MNSILKIAPLLVLGASLPATAAPYLVYEGSATTSANVVAGESALIAAKIASNPAKFHKLPAAIQKEINTALAKSVATETAKFYLVTDEANVANYSFLLLNPLGSGGKIASITGSNLTAEQAPQNFISGFEFPAGGGLGIFRAAITHPTGVDHVTNQIGSVISQIYGTGPINTTANAQIAPKQAAVTFTVVVNGVKGATINQPAFPAILSTGQYIPSLSGQAFGYYFDDAATQSIGGASTKGTFTMEINPSLTQLANNGGRYVDSKTNVANIAPVAASTTAAYTVFINSVMAVSGN